MKLKWVLIENIIKNTFIFVVLNITVEYLTDRVFFCIKKKYKCKLILLTNIYNVITSIGPHGGFLSNKKSLLKKNSAC